jgi:DHA1 family tetracycline resistance protein-like MFS transporter
MSAIEPASAVPADATNGTPLSAPSRVAPSRAAFIFIFVTVALDMLAFGIMAPVLPKLIIDMEHGDIARAASYTGIFGFTWAAMQFVVSPVVGALSDRYGRRPIILMSNFGLGADYVLMALAPNLSWLFVGRIVSGITAASFATAGAYIADVTPPEKRAARFGMLGAAFGLGFVVGPAVGGLLGQIDLRLPFWVAAGLSLANAAYGTFILPESLPKERRAKVAWHLANPFGALKLLRSNRVVLGLASASILYYLAHESLPSVFVLYATYRYDWAEREIGLALAVVGVCSTVVQAVLMGPVVKRLGERRALLAGLAFGVVGFVLFAVAGKGLVFLAGIPFIALWGLAGPSMQALMTRQIAPSEQGRLQGAISSMRGITGMLGPIIFTQALAAAVHAGSTAQFAGAPYYLAALFLLASLAWCARIETA